MHVYFVRHGETDLNRHGVHQSPSTPLNAVGASQARSVGETLRGVNPDVLLTSRYARAYETAYIIGAHVGLAPRRDNRFREVGRPSILAGNPLFSFRTAWYLLLSALHRNTHTWRYKDAENFYDIHARASQAINYLESLAEDHGSVIIVSHSEFINLMIAYLCHGRALTAWELFRILFNVGMQKNCSIAHVEYIGKTHQSTCAWMRHRV